MDEEQSREAEKPVLGRVGCREHTQAVGQAGEGEQHSGRQNTMSTPASARCLRTWYARSPPNSRGMCRFFLRPTFDKFICHCWSKHVEPVGTKPKSPADAACRKRFSHVRAIGAESFAAHSDRCGSIATQAEKWLLSFSRFHAFNWRITWIWHKAICGE